MVLEQKPQNNDSNLLSNPKPAPLAMAWENEWDFVILSVPDTGIFQALLLYIKEKYRVNLRE